MTTHRFTLDPISTRQLPIEIRQVESIIPCGFRTEWLSGSAKCDDGSTIEYNLDCGAGLGSPWLTLVVTHKRDGETLAKWEECFDMRDLAQSWIAAVIGDLLPESPVPEPTEEVSS